MLVLLDDVSLASLVLRVLIAIIFFFFQAEDGIRDLVRSRGLGDVYKRQLQRRAAPRAHPLQTTGQDQAAIGLSRELTPSTHRLSLIHI